MHARACPKCGKVVPWIKGKKRKHTFQSGFILTVFDMLLICPEHGEFRNPAESLALKKINNLEVCK